RASSSAAPAWCVEKKATARWAGPPRYRACSSAHTSATACTAWGAVERAAANGMGHPRSQQSVVSSQSQKKGASLVSLLLTTDYGLCLQVPLEDRKAALPPEVLLVEARQVRRVRGGLGRQRLDVGVLQAQAAVAQQVQRERRQVARVGRHEAEQPVDPLGRQP